MNGRSILDRFSIGVFGAREQGEAEDEEEERDFCGLDGIWVCLETSLKEEGIFRGIRENTVDFPSFAVSES